MHVKVLDDSLRFCAFMTKTVTNPRIFLIMKSSFWDVCLIPLKSSTQAAVLVTKSSFDQELFNEHAVGPAMVHPVEHVTQGPPWSNLLEGGVQRALIVGVGIQILQQVKPSPSKSQL